MSALVSANSSGRYRFAIKGFPVEAVCLVGVYGVAEPVALGQNPVAFHFPDIVLMRLKIGHVEAGDPLQFRFGILDHL